MFFVKIPIDVMVPARASHPPLSNGARPKPRGVCVPERRLKSFCKNGMLRLEIERHSHAATLGGTEPLYLPRRLWYTYVVVNLLSFPETGSAL